MPDGGVTYSGPFPWETQPPPPADPSQDPNAPPPPAATPPDQPFPWEQNQDQQPATGPPTPLVPSSPQPAPPATPAPAPAPASHRVTPVPPGVDPELHAAMATAFSEILPPGYTARITSGVRSNNPASQHFLGHAEDWQIYDPQGNPINNRGPDISGYYHAAAVQALLNLHQADPAKAQQFAWGNYFETVKGSGTRDIMHYDIGGPRATPGYGDPYGIYREAANLRAQFANQAAQPPAATRAPATSSGSPLPDQPFPWESQPAGTRQDATSQLPDQPFPWENQQQPANAQQLPEMPQAPTSVPQGTAPPPDTVEGAPITQPDENQAQAAGILPDAGAALGAGLVQGPITAAGQILAGPGRLIAGTGAQVASNIQKRAQDQLAIMDTIDQGGMPKIDPLDMTQQSFASMYRDMNPDQRAATRDQLSQQLRAEPPVEQTPLYKGAQSVGGVVAAPGDWVTAQGEKFTPPPGYEDSISFNTGRVLGSLPVYIGTMMAGGLPAVLGTAASQTYTSEYDAQVKNGITPEDAAANAGLKAIIESPMMAAPVARWATTLSGIEKRAFVAAALRMAEDGVFMGSVEQAQRLVGNIVDKATTEPTKSVTEGLGKPEEIVPAVIAGMAPGVPGLAVAGTRGVSREPVAERPAGAPEGAQGVALQPPGQGPVPGGAGTAPGPEAGAGAVIPRPPAAAPAPDETQVQPGIAIPAAADQGGTLVRATDSSGNNWIGHAGVLVNEGQNPAVDAHFRQAEQTQPVNDQSAAIDDLVSNLHVNATQGITWSDVTHDAEGRVVVIGQDAEGHAVELPEERYAVLGQYGDPSKDAYLSTRPGEPPMVVMRNPDTQTVQAIAQGRPPAPEPLAGEHTTFEEQDEARAAGVPEEPAGEPPPDVPDFYARPSRVARQPSVVPPDITDRPSLYRQAFRDAGYDPDVAVNKPIGEQQRILANHIQNSFGLKVQIDPKMQPQKSVDSLLDAYRNLQWMAHGLGYPIKAMSLDGKLTLRQEGWQPKTPYFGMYDPSTRTIHMPDRSNSFAHEWTHALDHELVSRLALHPAQGQLATSQTREGGLDVGRAMTPGTPEEAFARVMNAIFHDQASLAQRIADLNVKAQGTGQAARQAAATAQRLLAGARPKQPVGATAFRQGARSRYHAMPEELLARAHEAYVAHTVANAGGGNEFITKGDTNYLSQATQRFNDLYPHGPDRDAIFKAFQDLHGVLQRNQVLGHAARAGKPGDYDILDPIHWTRVGDPGADPQVTGGLRRAVTRQASWYQRMRQGMYERAGAVPGQPRTWTQHFFMTKDAITPLIHSNMGQIDVYRERYEAQGNHEAAHILSNVLDKLGYRYGENRYQATPFERMASRITNVAINKLDGIMNRNGMPTSRLNVENERQLWDALRGRTTGPVDPNIQRAAGEIRGLLNDFWYEIERGGISVGMPRDENYVPIVYDERAIRGDGEKALNTITQAMQADFDVKQGRDKTFIHGAYNDVPRANFDKSVHDNMAELARVQEAMRAESDPQKLAQLGQQEKALLDQLHQPIRDAWAQQRAGDWIYALEDVPWAQSGVKNAPAPSANPLRARVLSAEARDILSPYIVTRPSELLPYYFHQMGRKIAFARTFGEDAQVLKKAMRDLMAAKVSMEDRTEIEASMRSALGMLNRNEMTLGYRFGVKARTLATMALMGRATWSTLGEPMVVTAQTNSVSAGLHAFGDSMRTLVADLNLLKPSDRVQHLRDIANVLGVTSTRLQEAMLTGRVEAFSWSPGKTMANFYRRIGLTQLTNANKVAAIGAGHAALKIWGRQILDSRRGSLFDPRGEYRELGIPNSEHEAFARWVTDLDHLPDMNEINQTPQGQRWGEAVRRFVEKTVLEPTAAEKPRAANSALGRFVYGLMSYNYAFQRAVLNPSFNRLMSAVAHDQARFGKLAGTATGGAKWAAYAATAIGTMMAIQIPITMLRQEIFDHDRADQWRQSGDYLSNIMGLAFQRTGIGGVADPLVNAVTGLKYEHDLSSLALGAQMNFYMQAIKDLVSPFVAGSPDTNTASYRAWRGAWQLLGMPAAGLATALLPGGPRASWLISLLGQYASSMSAADRVATLIEGPKGEKTNVTRAQQLHQFYAQRHAPPAAAKETAGGGHASAGLLGLLDDFALPLLKAAPKLKAVIPFVR